MNKIIVTKDVLQVYDKYDGDFGLLDERWASEKDRDKVSAGQIRILGEFVEKLHLLKVVALSPQLRESASKRTVELEKVIAHEVAAVLRRRVAGDPKG